MKIILRILFILLIGLLVSGGLYLTIERTGLAVDGTSGPGLESPSAMTFSDSSLPPVRPDDGGHTDSASFTRGLSDVFVAVAKLTGIITLVLLVQQAITLLQKRWSLRPMAG